MRIWMTIVAVLWVIPVLGGSVFPGGLLPYAGHNNGVAVLRFQGNYLLRSAVRPTPAQARETISELTDYIVGPLRQRRHPISVSMDQREITIRSIRQAPDQPGWYLVRYRYSGQVMAHLGSSDRVDVLVPVRLETFYRDGMVRKGGRDVVPCSDAYYPGASDLFYFWKPDRPGCPYREGVHYMRVAARLTWQPRLQESYPEFFRMVDSEGIIRVGIVVGSDGSSLRSYYPFGNRDVGAEVFRSIAKALEKSGYERIDQAVPNQAKFYWMEWSQSFERAKIQVRLVFADTGMTTRDSGHFHREWREMLAGYSFVSYMGHSGLGENLDLNWMEERRGYPIRMPNKRYQLLLLDGCSTYSYFIDDFLSRKKSQTDTRGTRNLDIIANGDESPFVADPLLVLLRALNGWARGGEIPSYQTLLRRMPKSPLIGVIGDEDNAK